MKLPRDFSGAELVRTLERHGYSRARQVGSHVRLEHPGPPRHAITVPLHDPIKIGTLAAIVSEVVAHLKIPRDDVLLP